MLIYCDGFLHLYAGFTQPRHYTETRVSENTGYRTDSVMAACHILMSRGGGEVETTLAVLKPARQGLDQQLIV